MHGIETHEQYYTLQPNALAWNMPFHSLPPGDALLPPELRPLFPFVIRLPYPLFPSKKLFPPNC
jgi:hypothetical protein